jgi:hypothetical protein
MATFTLSFNTDIYQNISTSPMTFRRERGKKTSDNASSLMRIPFSMRRMMNKLERALIGAGM